MRVIAHLAFTGPLTSHMSHVACPNERLREPRDNVEGQVGLCPGPDTPGTLVDSAHWCNAQWVMCPSWAQPSLGPAVAAAVSMAHCTGAT